MQISKECGANSGKPISFSSCKKTHIMAISLIPRRNSVCHVCYFADVRSCSPLSPPKFLFFPSSRLLVPIQLRKTGKLRYEAARIIVPTINGGASCFSSSARARASVYLVSDLHRSPISGLCSKYT